MRMTHIITAGLIIGSTLTFTAPSFAASNQYRTVETTINLATDASRAEIANAYKVLKTAAEESCESNGRAVLTQRIFEQQCTARLLDDFIKSAKHSGLTQYYQDMQT